MARIENAPDAYVGVVARRGRFTVVEPLFERGRRVMVDVRNRAEVAIGDMVLVRSGHRGGDRGRAQVVRSLGRPDIARDVVEALLAQRGYERRFSRIVEQEALAASGSNDRHPRRKLSELATFTVDPASARDYDDAISIERDGDGLRLYVHIADVAAHVTPGSALDAEALRRGNSVYVPGTVEPMLPEALSSDACSLVAGAPRKAVTAELLISPPGDLGTASFYRSVIQSNARLTYDEVDEVFKGRPSPPREIAESLSLGRELAVHLRERRLARGALGLETSEPEFDFDSHGAVIAARDVVQTESHGLIEELMILVNEQVATMLERRGDPALYRVHEQPDPAAIEFLAEQLASLDVPTPPVPERMSPKEAGELAGAIGAKVLEYLRGGGRGGTAITSLVLRSLKQAIYSPRNISHAGLASSAYCHFTSPIRRYPDLVVHRTLLAAIGAAGCPATSSELAEIALHCSQTEREAMEVEREADDICLAFLLERLLFEEGWERDFEGDVSGVTHAAAFVGFGVGSTRFEGFLPARKLGGDYYERNAEQTALVGRRSGRRLRIGDPIKVKVRSVEPARGRVDLEPAGNVW